MKRRWKRILAGFMAACIIFGDSSLVYAAESTQPVVEASETEVSDEIPDEEIIEDVVEQETPEEETVTEEQVVEEGNTDVEESEAEDTVQDSFDNEMNVVEPSEEAVNAETTNSEAPEASTEEPEINQISATQEVFVNPLYEDIVSENDIVNGVSAVMSAEELDIYTSDADIVTMIREEMVARNASITFAYEYEGTYDEDSVMDLVSSYMNEAMKHTGNPKEGDYLRWNYAGCMYGINGGYSQGDNVHVELYYSMLYYTSAIMEAEMDEAVDSLMNNLALDDLAEYEQIRTIYDYICENVVYDNVNLENDGYKLKYTPYAALINGTAVCQGYATLFYRMALETGLDARVITGDAGGPHAWNIVELENQYYNLDSTWDAGRSTYSYFLKDMAGFTDHVRDEEYSSELFMDDYPMTETSYVEESEEYEGSVEGNCLYIRYWDVIDTEEVFNDELILNVLEARYNDNIDQITICYPADYSQEIPVNIWNKIADMLKDSEYPVGFCFEGKNNTMDETWFVQDISQTESAVKLNAVLTLGGDGEYGSVIFSNTAVPAENVWVNFNTSHWNNGTESGGREDYPEFVATFGTNNREFVLVNDGTVVEDVWASYTYFSSGPGNDSLTLEVYGVSRLTENVTYNLEAKKYVGSVEGDDCLYIRHWEVTNMGGTFDDATILSALQSWDRTFNQVTICYPEDYSTTIPADIWNSVKELKNDTDSSNEFLFDGGTSADINWYVANMETASAAVKLDAAMTIVGLGMCYGEVTVTDTKNIPAEAHIRFNSLKRKDDGGEVEKDDYQTIVDAFGQANKEFDLYLNDQVIDGRLDRYEWYKSEDGDHYNINADICLFNVEELEDGIYQMVYKQEGSDDGSDEEVDDDTFVLNKVYSTGTSDEWQDLYYTYYFTPEEDGYYGVKGLLYSVYVYDSEYDWIDPSYCKNFSANEESYTIPEQYYYLEKGETYSFKLNIEVPAEQSKTYQLVKDVEGDTATELVIDGEAYNMEAGEEKFFVIKHSDPGYYECEVVTDGSYEFEWHDIGTGNSYNGNLFTVIESGSCYIWIRAQEDLTVQIRSVETQTLNLNEEVSLNSGKKVSYEVNVDGLEMLYVKCDSYLSDVIGIQESGDGCWIPYDSIQDSDGTRGYLLEIPDNATKIAILVDGNYVEEDFSILVTDTWTFENSLEEWTGSVKVPAGSSVVVSYKGNVYGNFYISEPIGYSWNEASFDSIYQNNNANRLWEAELLDGIYYKGYGHCGYDSEDVEEAQFIFNLSNYTEEELTFELKTNEDFETWDLYDEGDGHIIVDVNDSYYNYSYDTNFSYYRFIPENTALYNFYSCDWVYRLRDHKLMPEYNVIMEAGEEYLLRFNDTDGIETTQVAECSGTDIRFSEQEKIKLFTPTVSGDYHIEVPGTLKIWNKDTLRFDNITTQTMIPLEAGETYIFWSREGKGQIGLKNDITVLDYDYYHALSISGGSVSIVDGELQIKEPFFGGFTLKEVLLSLLGLTSYGEQPREAFMKANQYWVGETGTFAASEYYRLSEDGTLTECADDSVTAGDILVVKYEPEIVWVDSMKVTAEQTMEVGATQIIQVNTFTGTENENGVPKYDFKETPELRFESSDEDVLTVDQEGVVTAVGEGTATITVYADETLKAQEGLKDIVTASVEIRVNQVSEILPAPTVEFYKDETGNITGIQVTNNEKSTVSVEWINQGEIYGHEVWCETLDAGVTHKILFADMELPTYSSFDTLKVYSFIAMLNLKSEAVELDYPLEIATDEYTGNEITFVCDNTSSLEMQSLVLSEDELPAGARLGSIQYLTIDASGNENTDVYRPDAGEWCIECSKDQAIVITSVTYYMVAPNTDGLKVTTTTIPESMIKYQEKTAEEYAFTYCVLEDGTACITGHTGTLPSELTIPSEIAGLKVTAIGSLAFESCTELKKVHLPDTLTDIHYLAFMEPFDEESYTCLDILFYASAGSYAYEWANNQNRNVLDPEEGSYAFKYEVLKNNTIAITDYVGELPAELVLPGEIDGYKVTAIGNFVEDELYAPAFEGCTVLKKVTLPEGIETIGFGAFARCSNLREINIPQSVTAIDNAAFRWCSSLEEIILPNGITHLGHFVFAECTNLKKANIPTGITTLWNATFGYCENLTEITIPDNITAIEAGAFWNCTGLEKIYIPKTVTTLGRDVFAKGDWNDSSAEITNMDITIHCKKDSAAHIWAVENDFEVVLEGLYKVTLTPNGGTINSGNILEYDTDLGAVLPKDVTKKDYTFAGWYDNNALTGDVVTEIAKGTTGAKNYYAKWTPVEYEITYEVNGGKVTNPIETYNAETEVTLPTEVKKDGYIFAGWYTNETLESKYLATEISAGSSGDKTFYAKWTVQNYPITYVLNGGTNAAINPSLYTIEEEIKLVSAERVGYTFLGWFENETDESANAVEKIVMGTTGAKTFYAKWKWSTGFTVVADEPTVVIPYDAENKAWDTATTHVSLVSTPKGFTIDDSKIEIKVTRTGEETGNEKKESGYEINGYNITFKEVGTYNVSATYAYGDGENDKVETNSVKINVVYGKRDYPINDKVEWKGISNLETGKTFADIIAEVEEDLIAEIHLERFEEKSEGDYAGEIALIKNSKGKVVYKSDAGETAEVNTKVASGSYTITYVLTNDTEGVFNETAEAVLNIQYVEVSLADFKYSFRPAEAEKNEGRIAGPKIAAPRDGINSTSYASELLLTPLFRFFDNEVTASELAGALGDSYSVAMTVEEAGKSKILSLPEKITEDFFEVSYDQESGNQKFPAKRNLEVTVTITESGIEEPIITLEKTIKNFEVVDGAQNVVKSVSVTIDDPELDFKVDSDELYLLNANVVAAKAKDYALNVEAYNFENDLYEKIKDAKLKWTSNNKSVAEVKVNSKTGEPTLNVKKGAVGAVDITAVANDVNKAEFTFRLFIFDPNLRVDTSSLAMNSLMDEAGILKVYPNVAAAGILGGEAWKVMLFVDQGDIFETKYNDKNGELNVEFIDPEQKDGKYKLTLHAEYYDADGEYLFESEEVTFTITNKQALPKVTVKATAPYNIAYDADYEKSYAEMLITTSTPIRKTELEEWDVIVTSGEFIKEKVEPVEGSDNQWKVTLSMDNPPELKANKSKSYTVGVSIGLDGYAISKDTNVKLTATNKAPTMYVHGNESYKTTLYPQLALDAIKVLVTLPEGVITDENNESSVTDISNGVLCLPRARISLTAAAAKHFEIVDGAYVKNAATVDKKNNEVAVGDAVLVTVRSISGKSANIQFMVDCDIFAEDIIPSTKTLKVNVGKITSTAVSMLNVETDKKVTSVIFQKSAAGKEILTVKPSIPAEVLKVCEMNQVQLVTRVEGADKNSQQMLDEGQMIVEQSKRIIDGENFDVFEMKSTDALFANKASQCKVKFTVYALNEDQEAALKSTTLTVKLQKKETTLTVKGSVKGNLNVVDPDGSVKITPTFKNLPLGAKIVDVKLDNVNYKINENVEEIQRNAGIFTISKFDADTELPIAKNKVKVTYQIQLMGGTTMYVSTTVIINTVQSATISASLKKITLFNSVIGEGYGKEIVFKETKSDAVIEKIELTGLEKSGLSWITEDGEDGEKTVKFYVDKGKARGVKKTYNAKASITLKGTGTKKGKPVTYDVSLKITLNN